MTHHPWTIAFAMLAAVSAAAGEPAETFSSSLHATRAGKAYWYDAANGGFEAWTGISMAELGCQSCHGPTDADGRAYPEPFPGASCVDCHASADNAVSEQQCYGCHGRQAMEAKRLQLPDVHRDAGMVCWDCHKEIDMHGDGSHRTSMLETGAVVTECVDCHPTTEMATAHAEHDPHNGALHCAACHTGTVITCYNCHFESQVAGRVKRPMAPLSGFVLLVNRTKDGTVYPATFQSLTYEEHSFVAYAPYTAHATIRDGRRCGECHLDGEETSNEALRLLRASGAIRLVTWDQGRRSLSWLRGVVPVPPDYESSLRMDFMSFNGDPAALPGPEAGSWTRFGEDVPDGVQMLFATPLTEEQMAKLGVRTAN